MANCTCPDCRAARLCRCGNAAAFGSLRCRECEAEAADRAHDERKDARAERRLEEVSRG